jgi:hypothetical protein
MDNIRAHFINFVYSKYFLIVCAIILSFFWQYAYASAKYYPLECSYNYSGYCNEGNDCFTKFGDSGVNYGDFCFDVPNNPHTFGDEVTGLGSISDQLDMIISGNIFLYNVVGFWVPFGVILNFCMIVVFVILFKFGYFRKQ